MTNIEKMDDIHLQLANNHLDTTDIKNYADISNSDISPDKKTTNIDNLLDKLPDEQKNKLKKVESFLKQNTITEHFDPPSMHGDQINITNSLSCGLYEMVTPDNPGSGPSQAPPDYFQGINLSGNSLNMARCGCDDVFAKKYKCGFGIPDDVNLTDISTPNLKSIFESSANNATSTDQVYDIMTDQINKAIGYETGGPTPDTATIIAKLQAMIGLEMCRFNNVSNPRDNIPDNSNSPSNNKYIQLSTLLFQGMVGFSILYIFYKYSLGWHNAAVPKLRAFRELGLFSVIKNIVKTLRDFILPLVDFTSLWATYNVPTLVIWGLYLIGILGLFCLLIYFTIKESYNNINNLFTFFIPSNIDEFINSGLLKTVILFLIYLCYSKIMSLSSLLHPPLTPWTNVIFFKIFLCFAAILLLMLYKIIVAKITSIISSRTTSNRPLYELYDIDLSKGFTSERIFNLFLLFIFIILLIFFILSIFRYFPDLYTIVQLSSGYIVLLLFLITTIVLFYYIITLNFTLINYSPATEFLLMVLYTAISRTRTTVYGGRLASLLAIKNTLEIYHIPFFPYFIQYLRNIHDQLELHHRFFNPHGPPLLVDQIFGINF